MVKWRDALFLFHLFSPVLSRESATVAATPLGKVVELMDVLKEHLDEDTLKDGDNYAAYAEVTVRDTTKGKEKISATKGQISSLQTDLDEEDASRQQMNRDLEASAAELSKAERELAEAKTERQKEHEEFVKNDQVFDESIDQLKRSLEVLAKRFQGQGQTSAALLAVASNLQNTLSHNQDLPLSNSQQAVLQAFVRAAAARTRPTISFLQTRFSQQSQNPEYGAYESQSSPVVDTLQKVETKTKENKEAAMKVEEKAVADFTKLEAQLQAQINTATTRMDTLKTQIAESEQRSSELTADLLAAKELLTATQKHVALLEQDFRSKTRAFKERALKRSDELTAVKEAIQVLTSETAKRFMSQQSIGTKDTPSPTFMQIGSESRRKALHLVQTVHNSGLMLLAVQTQSQLQVKDDPFDKVKSMIKQMLDKLVGEANKDADQHAFCESEMMKSTESHAAKTADVQKLTDQLTFMTAEIDSLTDELAQATKDLADMTLAFAAAAKVRETEKLRATQAIKDYNDAQALLKQAIKLLSRFYSKEAIAADTADMEGSKEEHGEQNREGLGHGIVAILEIALQDFTELEEDTRLEEAKSEQMFKDLSLESRIRTVQFQKDIEYKAREKVKIEGNQARAQADLKSYQKELSAVGAYLNQLEAQCIAKADPYEVRKARREKELQGLEDALQFLNGDSS